MKRRRSGTILIALGVILALVVAGAIYITMRENPVQTQVETIDVVVATLEIPERALLQPGNLAIKKVPASLAPVGAMSKIEQVTGKMTTSKIYPEEVILSAKLADTEGKSGIAYTLEQGQVLITFPASDIVTTNALQAGDCVDLFVTIKPPAKDSASSPDSVSSPVTQVTLQNLKLVGLGSLTPPQAGAQPENADQRIPLLTFAVPHQDALTLKALKDSGDTVLEVVLRAAGDDQQVTTDGVTIGDIIDKYQVR